MYVKLMADYCSSGVWAKSGSMMELEDLPISEKLMGEIRKWCRWYEESQFYYSPEDRTVDFDTKAFNRQGVLLSVKLGKELPGWRVVFRPE